MSSCLSSSHDARGQRPLPGFTFSAWSEPRRRKKPLTSFAAGTSSPCGIRRRAPLTFCGLVGFEGVRVAHAGPVGLVESSLKGRTACRGVHRRAMRHGRRQDGDRKVCTRRSRTGRSRTVSSHQGASGGLCSQHMRRKSHGRKQDSSAHRLNTRLFYAVISDCYGRYAKCVRFVSKP